MNDTICPIIRIDGQYLYRGKQRFIARGIVYQPRPRPGSQRTTHYLRRGLDPLIDGRYVDLLRDLHILKQLRCNTLWVYGHDPTASHKACMDLLAANGIYVVFATARRSRVSVMVQPHDLVSMAETLGEYSKVVDSVAQFENSLGICVGGRIYKNAQREDFMHRQRDVTATMVRELKRYMRYRNHDTGQRMVPLCIDDMEWSSFDPTNFRYFTYPDDLSRPAGGRIDFYCFWHLSKEIRRDSLPTEHQLSLFRHDPDRDDSSWSNQLMVEAFASNPDPVPVLISEYGSSSNEPRDFHEIQELYGTAMSSPLLQTLSGGFLYEFFGVDGTFGLVDTDEDGALKELPDFPLLRSTMRNAAAVTDNVTTDMQIEDEE